MAKNARRLAPNRRLYAERVSRSWTQQKLAEFIGTTFVNVSRWEKGVTFPSLYFRQQLCEIFGRTLAELDLLEGPARAERITTIPNKRNPFFTGRQELLEFLHKRLSITRTAALIQPQALWGLGGIGKTQTATEYAFRYRGDYTHVFWVAAASRDSLVADFVKLAELLDLPEKAEQNQRRMLDASKRWLGTHDGWLLILDNADDLPLAQEFLPSYHQGYILYTTRAQAAGVIAACVEVEKLNLDDGVLLLLRWTKLLDMETPLDQARPEDRAAAERIVREMDGLPLAIVQASAYVDETGCSLDDYLQLYSTNRKDLLERRSGFLLDYPETVANTWSLSFQQVEQENLAAANLLRLCAFLAPDSIPEELLAGDLIRRGGAASEGFVSSPFGFNKALEVLRKYSLIRRNRSTHMLTIHRLVQAVLRDSMDEETRRLWAERAVRAVDAVFPEKEESFDESHRSYLPHVQECATLIQQYQLHFQEAAQLLYKAGAFLYFHGLYLESQALHQQALALREHLSGSDQPTVADSLNALGMLSRVQGNYGQAESFHLRALAIREKSLGPKAAATGISLNNLGVLYRTQKKYEQAESFLLRALSVGEEALSPEHIKTLITSISLAKLYLEQRKYEQAEHFLKRAQAGFERTQEPGHPLIAQTLILQAKLFSEQGSHERAETFWKQALAVLEEKFGLENHALVESLDGLAELYLTQGRNAEAQTFYQRSFDICKKILGPEHPDTLAVQRKLIGIIDKKEAEQKM